MTGDKVTSEPVVTAIRILIGIEKTMDDVSFNEAKTARKTIVEYEDYGPLV